MELYLRLVRASIRARMQYKLDFLISSIMYALISVVDFLTVVAILYRYGHIRGWNVYEVAVLSGVASVSFGLFRVAAAELNGFESYLISGSFDSLLIRPWPTLLTLFSRNFDISRIGGALQGVLVLAIGVQGIIARGAPAWAALYVAILPVAGAAIITAVAMVAAAIGFWITRISDLQTFLLSAPLTAASYPIDIFPRWLRWFFTGIVPVAAMAYLPLRFILGKGGSAWSLGAPFVAAGVAMGVALAFWRLGERQYQSTGS